MSVKHSVIKSWKLLALALLLVLGSLVYFNYPFFGDFSKPSKSELNSYSVASLPQGAGAMSLPGAGNSGEGSVYSKGESSGEIVPQNTKHNTATAETIYANYQDALVAEFLGLSANSGFLLASRAAEKIYNRSSEADIEFLFAVMSLSPPQGFSEKEWQAMQSRSLDYLVKEWAQHAVAEKRLLAMLDDPTVPAFVKNDIVDQGAVMHKNSEDPKKVAAVLWEITQQQEKDIAATALTSLARISYHSHAIDTQRLNKVARKMSSSSSASPQNRVVAMEVANWLKSPEVYWQAVEILQGEAVEPEIVQLAAINTLIISGKNENMHLLEKIAESDNPTLKRAAMQAINLLAN